MRLAARHLIPVSLWATLPERAQGQLDTLTLRPAFRLIDRFIAERMQAENIPGPAEQLSITDLVDGHTLTATLSGMSYYRYFVPLTPLPPAHDAHPFPTPPPCLRSAA